MKYNNLINAVVKLGYTPCVGADYYDQIEVWSQWYKGYYEPFHKVVDTNGACLVSRKMNTLNMAKRVSEDWASALLNEKADITVNSGGSNISSVFIQGTRGDSGVLGSNQFFQNMNSLIERSFALGTGAVVISFDNVISDEYGFITTDVDSTLSLDFIGALRILPLSARNGKITECIFVSEEKVGKNTSYSLQAHVIEEGYYVIKNYLLDKEYKLLPTLKSGVLPIVRTLSKKPLFQIVKPAITNNVTDSDTHPMGISIFANALPNLKSCDLSFDDYQVELQNGKMKLFMDSRLLPKDANNNPIFPAAGNTTLYQVVGDGETITTETYLQEFAPELRIDAMHTSLQDSLNLLSNAVGLGNHYYSFDTTGGVTATEYVGQRNDFIRNCKKHSRMLESVISGLVSEILFLGKTVFNANVNVDAKVSVKCSDGVIEDDNTEKESDRKDVEMGIMSKAEYREKWYSETAEVAKIKIADIEKQTSIATTTTKV